ncbi:hypothetical protein F4604DRAFT_1596604, partial [Suillus subluteus]
VAADITGAILKKHAEHGQPAQYWDRAEQERRLMVAFDKWADKGIWSAAAQKVHQEQLKHVRKGCLERSIQGIRSDGSRIEGSHKGWNSLQRAQPSGVAMLTALAHDFVLRHNVQVAFSRSVVTPFIEFTHGSHHLQLCDYVARLHNTLQQDYTGSQLQVLPELHDVDSRPMVSNVTHFHSTFLHILIFRFDKAPSIEEKGFLLQGHPLAMVTSAGINNSVSAGINNSVIAPDQQYKVCKLTPDQCYTRKLPPEFLQDHPVCSSTGINNSVAVAAGQTRSQHLFLISTGIDPCSLTFQSSDEFYMFMDMWSKFKWLSYQMTSKRWVLATEEYNRCLMMKNGQSVMPKNSQALLRALGDIELKLMSKITKNDYTCESVFQLHLSLPL